MIRRLLARESTTQVIRLGLIGVLNTVNFFILLNLLRLIGVGLILSVTIAFAIATFVSYVLNRRWTFGLNDSSGGVSETVRFYAINVGAWLITVTIIWTADQLFGPLDRIGENLASLAAAVLTLLPKFLSYRDIVFGKAIAAARNLQQPANQR
ncbi:MAG: GtrA family protein [Actinomycetota bacterium]